MKTMVEGKREVQTYEGSGVFKENLESEDQHDALGAFKSKSSCSDQYLPKRPPPMYPSTRRGVHECPCENR